MPLQFLYLLPKSQSFCIGSTTHTALLKITSLTHLLLHHQQASTPQTVVIPPTACKSASNHTYLSQLSTHQFSNHTSPHAAALSTALDQLRSEERRVGKECRSRWSP